MRQSFNARWVGRERNATFVMSTGSVTERRQRSRTTRRWLSPEANAVSSTEAIKKWPASEYLRYGPDDWQSSLAMKEQVILA